MAPVTTLPNTPLDDELELDVRPDEEEDEDELDVLPVDEEEDDEEELELLPVDDEELDDELLELDGVGSMTPPPQANSKAVVATTPVSLIARLAFDSDLILSIVITLLVLVLTHRLSLWAGEDAVRNSFMFQLQIT